MTRPRRLGALILSFLVGGAVAAPWLTPHSPSDQFANYGNAPPMPVRVFHNGRLTAPFVYPIRLVDRLERRFAEDRGQPVLITWLSEGRLASVEEASGPWLPLGADPLGRDLFARLLYGARLSLGVAGLATAGALILGVFIGAPAGFRGGTTERLLMMAADFVLVLPAIYVVLVLRAALPLVLTVPQVFMTLTLVLAAAGWPVAARGVRAIVAAERRKEYAEAAHALGAGPLRILLRHLLPATTPFLASVATLMLPAFVLAEATVSLVGLGFPDPAATWGVMLRDASHAGALVDAPWLLAPAVTIALSVLALHLLTTEETSETPQAGTFS